MIQISHKFPGRSKYLLLLLLIFFVLPIITFSQSQGKNTDDKYKDMVLVPEGYFNMGSITGFEDEYPVRKVYVDSFYIDKFLVTNLQYKKFCDEKKRNYPPNPIWDTTYFMTKKDYPVVNIPWDTACAYAEWAGKRLPTEAEWEKAARGGTETKFYCGDTLYKDKANFTGRFGKDVWRHTSPVGTFDPNPIGLYDMMGNVWEWCQDYYQAEFYYTTDYNNPRGAKTGTMRVVRGGSWDSSYEYLHVSVRGKNAQSAKNSNVGFRCAISVKDMK